MFSEVIVIVLKKKKKTTSIKNYLLVVKMSKFEQRKHKKKNTGNYIKVKLLTMSTIICMYLCQYQEITKATKIFYNVIEFLISPTIYIL